MYQKILVPLDKSGDSEEVLKAVPTLVAAEGAAVLLHVIPPGRTTSVGQFVIHATQHEENEHGRAMAYLRPVAAQLEEQSVPTICAVVASDSVAQCIADFAERENADLIAMRSHGRKGLSKLFRGSVAAAVQRRSAVQVRILGSEELAEFESAYVGANAT